MTRNVIRVRLRAALLYSITVPCLLTAFLSSVDAQNKGRPIKLVEKRAIAYDIAATDNISQTRIRPLVMDSTAQNIVAAQDAQTILSTTQAASEIAGELIVTVAIRSNQKPGTPPVRELSTEETIDQIRQVLRSLTKRSLRVELKNHRKSTLLFRQSVESLLTTQKISNLPVYNTGGKAKTLSARLRKNNRPPTLTFRLKTKDNKHLIQPFSRRLKRIAPRSHMIVDGNSYSMMIAEPNKLYQIISEPNDPKYPEQWGLKKTVTADDAWSKSTGSGVTIAVIDTGVDYTHLDLRNQIALNSAEIPNNGIDDDANEYVDDFRGYDFVSGNSSLCSKNEDCKDPDADPLDVNGHGTHCAGIAGAKVNNLQSIAGACPDCKILPIRAGFNTSSGGGALDLVDILEAIKYAIVRRAQVVSMSFGGSTYSEHQQVLFDQGTAQGTIFVAAAGNEGIAKKSYPAAQRNVISVAATEYSAPGSERLAIFSQRGSWISVAAPGLSILSTIPGGETKSLSGTSMAAPLVAGIVGLIKAKYPQYDTSQIEWLLAQRAKRSQFLSNTLNPGTGEVNAFSALTYEGTPPSGAGLEAEIGTTSLSNAGLSISGIAAGAQFARYQLEMRIFGESNWTSVASSSYPVNNSLLGLIPSSALRGSSVDLRLTVRGNAQNKTKEKHQRVDLASAYQISAGAPVRIRGFLNKNDESESIAKRGTSVTLQINLLGNTPRIRWRKADQDGQWSTAGITLNPSTPNSARWDTTVVSQDGLYQLQLSDEINDGKSTYVNVLSNIDANSPIRLGDASSNQSFTFAGVLGLGRGASPTNQIMSHVRNYKERVIESSNEMTLHNSSGSNQAGFPQISYGESTVSYFPTRAELDGNPSTSEYVGATFDGMSNPGQGNIAYNIRGYASDGRVLFTTPIIESQKGRILWVGIAQNPLSSADLNGDGLSEIFYRQSNALVALDHTGKEMWREPLSMAYAILLDIIRANSFVGIGNFGNDGARGVAVLDFAGGSDQQVGETIIKVLGYDGKPLPGWPLRLPATHVEASIGIADFNGDKRSDIALITKDHYLFDNKPGQMHALIIDGLNASKLAQKTISQSRVREKLSFIIGDRDHNGKAEFYLNYPMQNDIQQTVRVVGLEHDGAQGMREIFSSSNQGTYIQPLLLANLDEDPATLELLVTTMKLINGNSGYTEDIVRRIEVLASNGKPQTTNSLHLLPFSTSAASINEISGRERALVLNIGLPAWNSGIGQWQYVRNGFSVLNLPALNGPDLFKGCGAWESLNGSSNNNNVLQNCGDELNTPIPTPTRTPIATKTVPPTVVPSIFPTIAPSVIATITSAPTSTQTSLPTATVPLTATPTSTRTPINTVTLTHTATITQTPTITPTATATPLDSIRIFVSSEKFSADLGGLAGADKKCSDLAKAAGYEGNYRAILSDSTIDAKNRFPKDGIVVDITKKYLASSVRDLFLGLAFVPTMTEKGVTLTNADDSITWTGCHRHGDRIGFTPEGYCNNWTSSSSASGTVFGNPTGSYRWLRAFDNQTTKPCSSTGAAGLRLYCLEQPGQTVFPTPTATATLTPTVTPTPSNTSIPGYRLFVTNDTVMGSMQRPGSWNAPTGVAAANALCQQEATWANLSGTWIALLPTRDSSFAEKIPGNPIIYNPLGGVIANSWNDLLKQQGYWVRMMANGREIPGGFQDYAWTGSKDGGLRDYLGEEPPCQNWTSADPSLLATRGAPAGWQKWLKEATTNCIRGQRLYCTEVKDLGDITATPTATATTKTNSVPTDTPTNTAVPTLIPTLIPSATRTPSATSTPSSTPSATKTSTATSSPTIASTRTSTPTVTATHSHTAISTATQTATPTATPTEATIPGALRIFQTSTTFKASVYGAEGAKAICVAIAQRAGLGGDDWDAIISEDGNSARDRLRIAGPIFLLNNTQIASSALDLWDGSISSRINITETGRAASSNNYLVWSGTNPNGTADTREHQRNCSNWSSVDGGAETGRTDAIDYRWLSIYAGGGQAANSCSNFGAFYCIEQRQVNTTRSVLSSDSYSSFQKRAERAKRLSLYELRGENLYFNIRFPGKGKSVGYYNVIVKRGKREHSSIIPSSNPSLLLGSKSLFATSPKVVVAVSALRSGMIVSSFTKRLRPQAIQIPNRIRVNKKHSNQKSALHNVKIETLSVLSHNKDNSYATTKDGALYSLSSAGKLSLVLDYSKITEAVGKITEVRKIGSQTFGVTDKGYLISTNNNNEPRADLLIQK